MINQRPGLSRRIQTPPGAGLLSASSRGSWAAGLGMGTGTGTGLGLLLHPPQVGRGQRRPAGGADASSPRVTGTADLLRPSPCWAARGHLLLAPPRPRAGHPPSPVPRLRGPDAGPGPERRQERGREPGGAPGAWGSPGAGRARCPRWDPARCRGRSVMGSRERHGPAEPGETRPSRGTETINSLMNCTLLCCVFFSPFFSFSFFFWLPRGRPAAGARCEPGARSGGRAAGGRRLP